MTDAPLPDASAGPGETVEHRLAAYGRTSRFLHWTVAVAFLGALGIGLLLGWLPREARGAWMDPHRAFGMVVLVFGAWRLVRRTRIGFPPPAAPMPRWQTVASQATHWTLLAATIAMPLSGVLMTIAKGRAVEIWGLTIVPALGDVAWLAAPAHALHEAALPVLVALVLLHVAGALKHHLVDRDGTLRRMTTGQAA